MVEHNVPPAAENDLVIAETDWLRFRRSEIHGTGAFARAQIPTGTRVIEYIGQLMNKAESLRQCEANNEYIFSLNEDQDINGNVPWNPARLINHSCAPNCEAILEAGRIWIVATGDISAGAGSHLQLRVRSRGLPRVSLPLRCAQLRRVYHRRGVL